MDHPAPHVPPTPQANSSVDTATFGLLIEQIADHAWRVSDPSDTIGPLPVLLGFIDERVDGFEVMHLGATFGWVLCDSLNQAVCSLKATARKNLAARQGGDLSWVT